MSKLPSAFTVISPNWPYSFQSRCRRSFFHVVSIHFKWEWFSYNLYFLCINPNRIKQIR